MPDRIAREWLQEQRAHAREAFMKTTRRDPDEARLMKYAELGFLEEVSFGVNPAAALDEKQQGFVMRAILDSVEFTHDPQERPHKKADLWDRRRMRILMIVMYINTCRAEA